MIGYPSIPFYAATDTVLSFVCAFERTPDQFNHFLSRSFDRKWHNLSNTVYFPLLFRLIDVVPFQVIFSNLPTFYDAELNRVLVSAQRCNPFLNIFYDFVRFRVIFFIKLKSKIIRDWFQQLYLYLSGIWFNQILVSYSYFES